MGTVIIKSGDMYYFVICPVYSDYELPEYSEE